MIFNTEILKSLKNISKISNIDKKKYSNKYIDKLKKDIIAEVRPSKIHGVGVFALNDIKKNTIIFENLDPPEEKIMEKNL